MADEKKYEEEDKLLDHEYDGIRELDNNLPPWWLNLFYITIVWAVLYVLYYHVFSIGDLSATEYLREMNPNYVEQKEDVILEGYQSPWVSDKPEITPWQRANNPQFADLYEAAETEEAAMAEVEEDVTYEPTADAGRLANGQQLYLPNCASCHGQQGGGGIGPNLTDNYWVNGDGSFTEIVKVVQNGVPVKGMIAWKGLLSQKEIIDVSSHVETLQGTNPPNAKAPQGTQYE